MFFLLSTIHFGIYVRFTLETAEASLKNAENIFTPVVLTPSLLLFFIWRISFSVQNSCISLYFKLLQGKDAQEAKCIQVIG
jgi:hypothetical protein